MGGKKFHFSVGECGGLMFTKATVGTIFDLRKMGLCTMGISSHFYPIFLPFSSTTSCHNPPQPTSRVLCPLFPHFPTISPIPPHFSPFPPIFPISPVLKTPKSWFGELVSR